VAADTLKDFAPDARSAIPALTQLLDDSDPAVKATAKATLDRINRAAAAKAKSEARPEH
jgi:hypothetical protein